MDKQMLICYLEDVVELEKQVFLQQKTLDALDSKIRSLGIRTTISKPVYDKDAPIYEMPKNPLKGAGGIIGMALLCFTAVIFIGGLLAVTSSGDIETGMWITAIIAGVSVIPFVAVIAYKANKSARDDYNNRVAKHKADYERKLTAYKKKIADDALRVNRELAEEGILASERSDLAKKHKETKQVLQSYYDLDIIYGKYRNFVAVSSFVDYFKSGRCSTLGENTGGDGAYNTFETEVRLDRIIDRLDVVISMLSQIKSNQWCIYNAIQEGNSIARRLVSATESLAESNAQIALSSAQTAQYSAQAAQYSAQTAQYAGITAANSAIAAYNAQQAANEAEHLRKLKQYELGIRGRRY